jgi:hypothetical protein
VLAPIDATRVATAEIIIGPASLRSK